MTADATPTPWARLSIGGVAELAKTLNHLRRHARLTQQALAHAAGVSPSVVSVIERGAGTNPSLRTLSRLACALDSGVSVFTSSFVCGHEVACERMEHDHLALESRDRRHPVDAIIPRERDDAVRLGQVLRSLRLDVRLTLRDVARRGWTSPWYLSVLERGCIEGLGLLTLSRITHAIGGCRSDLEALDHRLALLAQTFAGEITVGAAIRQAQRSTQQDIQPHARVAEGVTN